MKGWVGVPEKMRKSLSWNNIKQYKNKWDLNLNVLKEEKYKYLNSLTGFFRSMRSHVHAPSVATKDSAVRVQPFMMQLIFDLIHALFVSYHSDTF